MKIITELYHLGKVFLKLLVRKLRRQSATYVMSLTRRHLSLKQKISLDSQ